MFVCNKISISFPFFTLGNFYREQGRGEGGGGGSRGRIKIRNLISGEGRRLRRQNKILRGLLPAPLSNLSQTRITKRFSSFFII